MTLWLASDDLKEPVAPEWSPDGKWLSFYYHFLCQCLLDFVGPYLMDTSCLPNMAACGTKTRRLGNSSQAVAGLQAWFPDSRLLAGTRGESLDIFDAATGQKIRKLDMKNYGGLTSLAWSPDAKSLAFVQNDPNELFVISTDTGRWILDYPNANRNTKIVSILQWSRH